MKRWACIARLGGIGDNLVAGSPLACLKRQGYMTEVITAEPNHVLYFHNPYLDKLSVKKADRDLPQGDMHAWQKWFESRANEYDVFVHATNTMEGRHSVFRAMSSFYWRPELLRKVCAGSYLETIHDAAGVPYDFGPLFFASDEEKEFARRSVEKVGGPYLLWVLCGTRYDKVYPYTTSVVPRIIRELGIPVVLMGGPSEKERAMAKVILGGVSLDNSTRDGLHVAVPDNEGSGCWPLRISMAIAQGASLVVTPDTGTAWAVATEPMPKIVMVSHASAENITKHWVNTTTLHADPDRVPCWPCHKLHDDPSTCVLNKEGNGAACISDITVEELVQAVKRAWNSGNVIHAEQVFAMAGNKGPQNSNRVSGS